MKNKLKFILVFTMFCAFTITGCEKKVPVEELEGKPGNPRFNLQFTNDAAVDLDLYVETPDGSIIYYGRKTGQGGTLDIDCKCLNCPNGPNENIYWVDGTAPSGTYKFYVWYYNNVLRCNGNPQDVTSTYTLRLVKNNEILETYTGTLSPTNRKSAVYTFIK